MIATEREKEPGLAQLAALVVLPVVLFYAIVAWLNTDLPTEDDFHGLFGYALQWLNAGDLPHRLLLIVTFQHNEYKMPLVYSLLSGELALTHRVSIPLWIWAGNLLAVLLLLPLWTACAPGVPTRQRLVVFAPVVWMVMSLGYAETLDFALSGLQVVAVVLLSLCAVALIAAESRGRNLLGCVCALLAAMIYANAFLLAPLGIPLLLLRRKFAVFGVWVAAFALALAAFLFRYHSVPHPWPGVARLSIFFVALVGGPFGAHRVYGASLFAGAGLLTVFAGFAWRRADRVQPFAFWTAVWLLLGFLLTAYGRASLDLSLALSSRYKIYGDLFLAVMYLQAVALWQAGTLRLERPAATLRAVVACAVLFGLGSDALGWHRLSARRYDVLYGTRAYVQSNGAVSPMVYPRDSAEYNPRPETEEEARQVLTSALKQGIYHLPTGF